MLERWFRLAENRTTVRTEVSAGVVTFLTMAYIIVVQPAVLSGRMFGFDTGMDFGAVTTATCLAAALATAVMALYARYPIAQAPGMGENFFFVLATLPAAKLVAEARGVFPWQVGLGVVFYSGVLFLLLTLTGFRERMLDAVSPSVKNAIAAGIGLFVAFIGLQNAGIIVKNPGTAVALNPHLHSPDSLVFFFGLVVAAVLHARRLPGSILWGIGGATLLSIALRTALPHVSQLADAPIVRDSLLMTRFAITTDIVSAPPSVAPLAFQMDLVGALDVTMLPFVGVFLFMVLFDTVGTLIGVGRQAGFIVNDKLPRADRAMLSDAVGTVAGACLGTSTVTSFIESAAGVEQGGRTGLTALVTAALFLIAPFFSPLIAMIGSYPPITAPALVLVGAMMMKCVAEIEWQDPTEAIPAFLTMIGIPLSYSIADGLALGLISYPTIKILSGRRRDVNTLMIVLAVLLVAYFTLLRSRVGG
jgi:AGZA family xanthine/uracil permease-like MFS transporter